MLADAHYSLYVKHRQGEDNMSTEESESLPLRDCYLYGTSTANILVETGWKKLIDRQTRPWLV